MSSFDLFLWIDSANKANESLEYPDQSTLVNALQYPPSDDLYEQAISLMAEVACVKGLDQAFDTNGLDLLAVPMDSLVAVMAAASGKSLVYLHPCVSHLSRVSDWHNATRTP